MKRLFSLTRRSVLIVLHDIVATAAAIVATFGVRFDEAQFAQRLPALKFLPLFLDLRRGGLFRLQPAPQQVALHLAARPHQHRARRDRAGAVAAGARLHSAGAATSTASSSSARSPSCCTGSCRCSCWPARAWSIAISTTRARIQRVRVADARADAGARPRRRRRGAAARDRERRGAPHLAGRHPVAVARRPRPVDPRHPGAGRASTISNASSSTSRRAAPASSGWC